MRASNTLDSKGLSRIMSHFVWFFRFVNYLRCNCFPNRHCSTDQFSQHFSNLSLVRYSLMQSSRADEKKVSRYNDGVAMVLQWCLQGEEAARVFGAQWTAAARI